VPLFSPRLSLYYVGVVKTMLFPASVALLLALVTSRDAAVVDAYLPASFHTAMANGKKNHLGGAAAVARTRAGETTSASWWENDERNWIRPRTSCGACIAEEPSASQTKTTTRTKLHYPIGSRATRESEKTLSPWWENDERNYVRPRCNPMAVDPEEPTRLLEPVKLSSPKDAWNETTTTESEQDISASTTPADKVAKEASSLSSQTKTMSRTKSQYPIGSSSTRESEKTLSSWWENDEKNWVRPRANPMAVHPEEAPTRTRLLKSVKLSSPKVTREETTTTEMEQSSSSTTPADQGPSAAQNTTEIEQSSSSTTPADKEVPFAAQKMPTTQELETPSKAVAKK